MSAAQTSDPRVQDASVRGMVSLADTTAAYLTPTASQPDARQAIVHTDGQRDERLWCTVPFRPLGSITH